MVRRTRDIQKKIWLTPQEERTIAKKMEMIGTENFGAYARKMLIDGYGTLHFTFHKSYYHRFTAINFAKPS